MRADGKRRRCVGNKGSAIVGNAGTAELALLPEWGNTATRLIRVRVPVGQVFYEGAAAAQGDLLGQGNQIWLPRIESSWFVYVRLYRNEARS